MSITADDWAKAETLAREYFKTEKKATDPIEVYRADPTPFLIAATWPQGHAYVLVFDGKVQTARGLAALPPYFSFLGADRLRTMSIGTFEGLLEILDAVPKQVIARRLNGVPEFPDLVTKTVETDGVLKYVVHYLEPAAGGPGGSRAPGPRVINRWSLQLFPPTPDIAWKHEERFEREPAPPKP